MDYGAYFRRCFDRLRYLRRRVLQLLGELLDGEDVLVRLLSVLDPSVGEDGIRRIERAIDPTELARGSV